MDDILGGGSFKSRLMNKIRNELGLAYSIWSVFGFGSDAAAGIFEVHAKTMNEKAPITVDLIVQEINRLSEGSDLTKKR